MVSSGRVFACKGVQGYREGEGLCGDVYIVTERESIGLKRCTLSQSGRVWACKGVHCHRAGEYWLVNVYIVTERESYSCRKMGTLSHSRRWRTFTFCTWSRNGGVFGILIWNIV